MREPCDCANPACELPSGRCAVCGNPCEADAGGTEVCAGCIPVVSARYTVEQRAFPAEETPGWALFNYEQDGSACIQKDDESDVYEDDEAAAAHVVAAIAPPSSAAHQEVSMTSKDVDTYAHIISALAQAFPGVPPTVALVRLIDLHADHESERTSQKLTSSDLARVVAALRDAATRELAAATSVADPATKQQLEHQAEHAATLATELSAAEVVFIS